MIVEEYIQELEEDIVFLIFTHVTEKKISPQRAQELSRVARHILKEGITAEELQNSVSLWEAYPEFHSIAQKITTDSANNKLP